MKIKNKTCTVSLWIVLMVAFIFGASLAFSGEEFLVNTYTDNNQEMSSVSLDSSGNFVIAWQSYEQDGSGYGIYAQRYDFNGNPIGSEFQVNSYTSNNQRHPSVAMDIDGNWIK